MPKLNVVEGSPSSDKVFFGAWVTLEKDDGSEVEYRIVGPDETDADLGFISMDSPLAQALMKKAADDEVSLIIKEVRTNYIITEIRYE